MPPFRVLLRFFALAAPFTMYSGVALAQGAPKQMTLPNGRLITPAGDWLKMAPYPFSIAVRPDGLQLAIPSIRFPFTLNVAGRDEVTGALGQRVSYRRQGTGAR